MTRFFRLIAASLFLLPAAVLAQDLGTINFDFDSDVLDAGARQEIAQIAQRLKDNPSYKPTVVVGYTDAVGSSGYNQALGQRRAKATANALIAAGVPVSRIGTIESRGKNELLVAVATPERRNRRVTVTLDDILAACRSYRDIPIAASGMNEGLQSDLTARLQTAVTAYATLQSSGANGPAFQMAGAAREDCGTAVGFDMSALRKREYSQRCLCSSYRLEVALNGR